MITRLLHPATPGWIDATPPDFEGRYTEVVSIRERGITRTLRAVEPQTGCAVFIKLLSTDKVEDATTQRIFCREPALLRWLAREAPEVPIVPVLDMGRWQG